MVKSNPVLGIIGGGQLGSMLSAAAKKLQIKMGIKGRNLLTSRFSVKNTCEQLIKKF